MNTHGVWSATVKKDLDGVAYQFRVYHEESFYQDTRDPYSIAISLDNKKKVWWLILRDLSQEGMKRLLSKKASWRKANACSSVICEMHIRDFSISETSGVKQSYRGTSSRCLSERD